MHSDEVRVRSSARGSDEERRTGLEGHLSVFVGRLIVDGLVQRCTLQGRFALSFPSRTDRAGRRHPCVRRIEDDARVAIEREFLEQLGQHPDLDVATEEPR